MGKKLADTINSPLMYISQPAYPPVKLKMQQTYIAKPVPRIIERTIVVPVEENITEEKQVPVEAVTEENSLGLKKNPIEEQTVLKKERIEENEQQINAISKIKTDQSENIIVEKPKAIKHIPIEKQGKTETIKVEIPEKAKNIIVEEPKPVENFKVEKPKTIKNITVEIPVNTESIVEEKSAPIEASKVESKPSEDIIEEKQEPIKSTSEKRRETLREIIKGKLPSLEDIIDGKPVHIMNTDIEQAAPVPVESLIEENIEPIENDFVEEEFKPKKSIIATYGLRSSIEKGRKAVSPKRKLPIPKKEFQFLGKKQEIELHEQNVQELEQVQQKVEEEIAIKQRPKQFKEMSIEEKVDYLVNLPIVVPKTKCEIRTINNTFQGIVAGYVNGVVQIVQRRKPFRVDLKIEDIISITRKSF